MPGMERGFHGDNLENVVCNDPQVKNFTLARRELHSDPQNVIEPNQIMLAFYATDNSK